MDSPACWSSGSPITKSFSYTILIYLSQIPGYFSAAYFNDKIGRKYTILAYMLLSCLSAGQQRAMRHAGMLLSFGEWRRPSTAEICEPRSGSRHGRGIGLCAEWVDHR